jgi:hypothetical protein
MILGLDIGGANLKAATSAGVARSRPFAVWKRPHDLGSELGRLITSMPAAETLAVTMTAELCDCFTSKREGVLTILDAVQTAAGTRAVWIWRTDGRFVPLEAARHEALLSAASNWLALATYAGRFCPAGPSLLIDIGSTTTDLIPMSEGEPVPCGRTDLERLATGELVYTGVSRTPLCALLRETSCRGQRVPLAAEWFATTLDVYLLLEKLPDQPSCLDTADGRPATRHHAHARLGRMLCADTEEFTLADAIALAQEARDTQSALLEDAISRLLGAMEPKPTFLISGAGEFLIREVLKEMRLAERVISLADRLGPAISEAACAFAVACLAEERCR